MTYIKFINLYQQNMLAKKKYYLLHTNKINIIILKKFIQLGLIKYVKINTKNSKLFYVFINYIKYGNVSKKIKTLYKPSKKQNIKIKTLEIQKKFKTNSTILLLTSKGLLTNFEALEQKIGGILLCQINY